MKAYTLQDHLRDSLKNPDFKKAWEESEAEYQVSRALIAARIKNIFIAQPQTQNPV